MIILGTSVRWLATARPQVKQRLATIVLVAIHSTAACLASPLLADERSKLKASTPPASSKSQATSGTAVTQARLGVPETAAVARAEQQLRASFKAELEKPSVGPRLELAKRLITEATAPLTRADNRYAQLKLAQELATTAGDVHHAMRAVRELERAFAIDGLAEKVSTLTDIAHTVSPFHRHYITEHALAALDGCLTNDRSALAEQLILLAEQTARGIEGHGKRRDYEARLKVRSQEIADHGRELASLDQARDTLRRRPEDATANGRLGRYLCLVKDDWKDGLQHLQKGNDPTLRELAARDLNGPKQADEQFALALDWQKRAQKEPAETLANKYLLLRAARWFDEAKPGLRGDRLKEATRCLNHINHVTRSSAAESLEPKAPEVLRKTLKIVASIPASCDMEITETESSILGLKVGRTRAGFLKLTSASIENIPSTRISLRPAGAENFFIDAHGPGMNRFLAPQATVDFSSATIRKAQGDGKVRLSTRPDRVLLSFDNNQQHKIELYEVHVTFTIMQRK